jgi:hypothetical protein
MQELISAHGVQSRGMRILAFFIAAFIFALTYFLYHQDAVIKAQGRTIEKLTEELSKKPKDVPLELQEKCAAQAKRKVDELGFNNKALAGFENHYNDQMSKCFVEIDDIDSTNAPTIWTHKSLIDAYGGKSYGEYHWHTEKDKKYWEVLPFSCKVLSSSGEDQICKSNDEYEALIKVYLEN